MGRLYSEIPEEQQQFIKEQKIFFIGTATADSRVNISPKGMDSLRILSSNRVIWLNVTGSGNETAAHIQSHSRMTVMFTAFEGKPRILRLYGQARVIHQKDAEWDELVAHFPALAGARQIFDLDIDLVQTSCGMSVPYFDYAGERDQLTQWAEKAGEDGIRDYWLEKNQISLDGIPTHIKEKNIG